MEEEKAHQYWRDMQQASSRNKSGLGFDGARCAGARPAAAGPPAGAARRWRPPPFTLVPLLLQAFAASGAGGAAASPRGASAGARSGALAAAASGRAAAVRAGGAPPARLPAARDAAARLPASARLSAAGALVVGALLLTCGPLAREWRSLVKLRIRARMHACAVLQHSLPAGLGLAHQYSPSGSKLPNPSAARRARCRPWAGRPSRPTCPRRPATTPPATSRRLRPRQAPMAQRARGRPSRPPFRPHRSRRRPLCPRWPRPRRPNPRRCSSRWVQVAARLGHCHCLRCVM